MVGVLFFLQLPLVEQFNGTIFLFVLPNSIVRDAQALVVAAANRGTVYSGDDYCLQRF